MTNLKSILGVILILFAVTVDCSRADDSDDISSTIDEILNFDSHSLPKQVEKSADGSYNQPSALNYSGSKPASQKVVNIFGKPAIERFEQMFKTGNYAFGYCGNNGGNILHYAALTGDLERVQWLVVKGADIFITDNCGYFPLHFAAKSGNLKLVQWLVEKGAAINNKMEFHMTDPCSVLHSAAESGNLELVKWLVEKGADVNAKDNREYTVLHSAAESGNLELVKWLMAKGLDENATTEGRTLLHFAAKSGNLELVKWLAEKGLDVNENDAGKKTPLHYAAGCEFQYSPVHQFLFFSHSSYIFGNVNLEVVKYLVEKGANVNDKDNLQCIPLHFAANNGNLEVVKYLVEKGSNINEGSFFGESVLHVAAQSGNLELVKYLVKMGANAREQSVLHFAANSGNLELVKYLVKMGANINARNAKGGTALHNAAFSGNLELVKWLVAQGLDVNATYEIETKRPDGTSQIGDTVRQYYRITVYTISVLDEAIINGHLEIVKYLYGKGARGVSDAALESDIANCNLEMIKWLVEHGADINSKDILISAAQSGSLELVSWLVLKGANVNTQYPLGSVLESAIASGNLELVQWLVTKGAAFKPNDDNSTYLYSAADSGNQELVKWLVEKGADIKGETGSLVMLSFADNGNLEMVKWLVERGADVNASGGLSEEITALQLFAKRGNLEMVKFLVEHGADINSKSVLIPAMNSKNKELVKYLVEHGADVNDSVLKSAASSGNLEMVQYLQRLKENPKPSKENPTASEGNSNPSVMKPVMKTGRKAGERKVVKINGEEFAFRWCPAGTFMMGSSKDEEGRDRYEKQRKVMLSKGFWIMETEVTQRQYYAIMHRKPKNAFSISGYESDFIGPFLPVADVSWDECQEFCKKCAEFGLPVQLPTEAQWEYACRAGTTTEYFWGDALNGDKANCRGDYPYGTTTKGIYLAKFTPVGSYQPNAWGLYDMHGNVGEWCQDWDDSRSENNEDVSLDPTGPLSGTDHIIRGGDFRHEARRCRSGARYTNIFNCFFINGFRCIAFELDEKVSGSSEKGAAPQATNLPVIMAGSKAGERKIMKVKDVEFAFRWCPAGVFTMGSPKSEDGRKDNENLRHVTLSNGFWMMETEVTQKQWKAVMGTNPSHFKGDDLPVEQVSWNDCQEFCQKCAELGMPVQLPTEAQWEYACRAGGTTAYFWGNSLNGDMANCDGNYPYGTKTRGNNLEKTTPVASYKPNSWGLYDMHGNVWEWCQDWYGEYPSGDVTDPTGASYGSSRVNRGGGWGESASACRSAQRNALSPNRQYDSLGFRCMMPVEKVNANEVSQNSADKKELDEANNRIEKRKNITPVLSAADKNELRDIESRIEKSEDITPILHSLIDNKKWDIVKYAMDQGVGIYTSDEIKYKSLSYVAPKGNVEMFKYVIELGFDVNAKVKYNKSVLIIAAETKQWELVKLLVEKGADVKVEDESYNTPLSYAAEGGNPELVKLLVEKGADVNTKNTDGKTPLYYAAESGNLETVKILVEHGANVNQYNQMEYSAAKNYGYHFKFDLGAWTALNSAIKNGNLEIVKYLVEKGARFSKSGEEGRVILFIAGESGNLEVGKFLVKNGLDVNSKDDSRRTALHYVASNGNLKVVKYLVELGADINAKDVIGETPLYRADANHEYGVVKWLKEHGGKDEGPR
ncbi:MAG: ankyrin repeat domain-containing protein [Thermoguttaceae bacterium]|nr:ankyrin repeat domain-containing protein [Thermoguttaceae bacterium]